ncbi:MAG: sensor histidine kinase [Saprospiraceae bacterium]|nr:sensor histidine kinase [Saprospiraceae bacterium]
MNHFIQIFLVIVYTLWCVPFFAQVPVSEEDADKLRVEISKLKEGKEKAVLLLDLGEYLSNVNIDSAIFVNNQAFKIAENHAFNDVLLRFVSNQSFLYNYQGDFEKGLKLNEKGLVIARQMGDKQKEVSMLGNTGISYSYLNKYEEAMSLLQQAYILAEELGDKLRMTKLSGVMGGMLNNMSKSVLMDSTLLLRSISYHQKGLEMARQLNDSMLMSDNLNGIALGYNNLEQTEKAKPFVMESIEISKKIGLKSNYAYALSTLSKILRLEKKYGEAIKTSEEAVFVNKELGSVMGTVIALKELALNYNAVQKHTAALDKIAEAETLAAQQDMDYILDGIYINRANYFYQLKDYKNAYEYLLKGHTLADSLRGIDMKNQINELEKKYETAKKEQEILKLATTQKINQWIIYVLLFAFIALCIIAFSTYRNIKFKSKIVEQEKEQLKAAQKIESTASIIKGQEEERHRLAKDLHDGLGGMLSGLKYTLNNMNDNVVIPGKSVKSFDNAIHLLDQAIAEMRKVAHNMMPESLLKFGLDETLKDYISKMNASVPMRTHYQSYNYTKMEQSTEINLYRIIQEAINNAIKHAQATDLFIQIDKQDDQVHITMEDNGIGFDAQDEKMIKGIGLKNIADRVNYMNGKLEISSNPDNGTLIVIEIKTNNT